MWKSVLLTIALLKQEEIKIIFSQVEKQVFLAAPKEKTDKAGNKAAQR